ncbi:MAG TPA: hypothetical protein PKA59_04070 [Chakrabartia sp.]|nr:hypothetical protein [Chakrabartia sp.]
MRLALLPAFLALSACGSLNDPGDGGVTRREAQQLNEAAAALDDTSPAPNVANTPIPVVPQPPVDPELDAEAGAS